MIRCKTYRPLFVFIFAGLPAFLILAYWDNADAVYI